jgi:hypothetical protein
MEITKPITDPITKKEGRGTISIPVTITLNPEQWENLEKKFGLRAMVCEIGIDTPQLEDFIMFQILSQMKAIKK